MKIIGRVLCLFFLIGTLMMVIRFGTAIRDSATDELGRIGGAIVIYGIITYWLYCTQKDDRKELREIGMNRVRSILQSHPNGRMSLDSVLEALKTEFGSTGLPRYVYRSNGDESVTVVELDVRDFTVTLFVKEGIVFDSQVSR